MLTLDVIIGHNLIWGQGRMIFPLSKKWYGANCFSLHPQYAWSFPCRRWCVVGGIHRWVTSGAPTGERHTSTPCSSAQHAFLCDSRLDSGGTTAGCWMCPSHRALITVDADGRYRIVGNSVDGSRVGSTTTSSTHCSGSPSPFLNPTEVGCLQDHCCTSRTTSSRRRRSVWTPHLHWPPPQWGGLNSLLKWEGLRSLRPTCGGCRHAGRGGVGDDTDGSRANGHDRLRRGWARTASSLVRVGTASLGSDVGRHVGGSLGP
jgi:hypothetical protein